MKFSLKVWKFKVTIDLLDVDPSDKDISIGIAVSWK